MRKWLRSLAILVLVQLLGIGASWANKFDLMAGAFALEAKTSRQTGSASNLGAYKLNYATGVGKGIDISVGYSVIMSGTIGGDISFGFDLGLEYFPFSSSGRLRLSGPNRLMTIRPLWRPFVGMSFHQRQFQSVETNYAGFGVTVGTERSLDAPFDAKIMGRYLLLAGPNLSEATEMTVMAGLTYAF